jgi:hypothetical protein
MQTQYFIKRLEGLIASNDLELAISLLRKFTKYHSEILYKQVLRISTTQQQFRELAHISDITSSERIRYQHALTKNLLELLASLENSLPINLPLHLADLALHLLHAIADRDSVPSVSFEEVVEDEAKKKTTMLEAIPAAKPVRMSIGNLLAYALLLIMLGAITPGAYLLKQHINAKAFAPFSSALSQEEIADLAASYQLTEIKSPNHHLNFDQAIIAYWYGRMVEGLEAEKVETAFATFNEIITEAQEESREILTHEDLYMLASVRIDNGLLSQR